jgi:hypothetical protein
MEREAENGSWSRERFGRIWTEVVFRFRGGIRRLSETFLFLLPFTTVFGLKPVDRFEIPCHERL